MSALPRVDLPGLSAEEQEQTLRLREVLAKAVEQESHSRRQQRLMAEAMLALGKPIFRKGKPKRRKVTKHVRHMGRVDARVGRPSKRNGWREAGYVSEDA